MNHKDFAKTLAALIERLSERFEEGVTSSQTGMYNRVLALVKNLDVSGDGIVKPSAANLRLLSRLRGELRSTIINKAYEDRVSSFLSGFTQLKRINDTYYGLISSAFVPSAEKYAFILNDSIEIAASSLMDAGINERVIKPIREVLKQNITTGGHFSDLVESLKTEIKGSGQGLGALEKHVKQITTDSLNQYNATYNKSISEDLGLDFYYYAGGTKTTSRSYCRKRAGRYFHKREVEESASEKWSGKNPRTNASNIFTLRGGFNCGHNYHAVLTSVVPKDVRGRAKLKGYEFQE